MIIKKSKISVTPPERRDIIERFKVNTSTVYNALSYISNSEKAKEIRKYAIDTLGHKPYKVEMSV